MAGVLCRASRCKYVVTDKVSLLACADSGLGAVTARTLVETGARVVLADLSREAGDKMVGELGAYACFVETDVVSAA